MSVPSRLRRRLGTGYTDHEQSSGSPTEPTGLVVTVRVMQVEMVINLAPDEVCHSIEVLNAPCSIAVIGCLLQVAERSLMLTPQHDLMRSQPARRWPRCIMSLRLTGAGDDVSMSIAYVIYTGDAEVR